MPTRNARKLALGLVAALAMAGLAASVSAQERSGEPAEAPPAAKDRDGGASGADSARPDERPPQPRARSRERDDAPDAGCPYRQRKLELIV